MYTQPRVLFITIDGKAAPFLTGRITNAAQGTWAGSVNVSRKTVASELPSLVMPHGGNMVRIAANGVGSSSGLAGRILSGNAPLPHHIWQSRRR
jgi:hypothetical protein